MVMERNYAIWWLNMFMFREWIPKSRDSNLKSTSPSRIMKMITQFKQCRSYNELLFSPLKKRPEFEFTVRDSLYKGLFSKMCVWVYVCVCKDIPKGRHRKSSRTGLFPMTNRSEFEHTDTHTHVILFWRSFLYADPKIDSFPYQRKGFMIKCSVGTVKP